MVKYTAGSIMSCACFSAKGPGCLVQKHGIMDSIKYQQIKKSKPDFLCKTSYNGPCLDLPSGQWSKTNIKINTKMCHWAQNEASAMAVPVPWPEPYRKWVGWTEEKKHQHEAGNLKDLERRKISMNGLWSLVKCSPNSSGIIEENSELLSWEKDVEIIGYQ